METLLIGALAGGTVFLALAPGRAPGSPTPLGRLYARLGAPTRAGPREGEPVPWVRRLPLAPLVEWVRPHLSPRYVARTRRHLTVARLDGSHTVDDVVAMKAAAFLGAVFYASLLYLKKGSPTMALLLLSIAAVAATWPDAWLAGQARRRQEAIRRELPGMLSALAVALEAGLGLMAALGEVTRRRQGALAEELRHAVELHERGLSAAEALEVVMRRVEVPELTVVLTGLLQAFSKGSGHVVDAVRSQAAEAWQRRRRRAEALAQTASMKLFLPLALLALPGFLAFLAGPAAMKVLEFLRQ